MPFKMKPERLIEIKTLIDAYQPTMEPLSQKEALALARSWDTVRVHLYAWHLQTFQEHEQRVLERLGHVCHLEHKKIRSLLAQKHRNWLDQVYPWLNEHPGKGAARREAS